MTDEQTIEKPTDDVTDEERAERFVEHAQRLEEMREAKREHMESTDTSSDKPRTVTGYITDANITQRASGSERYTLTVELPDLHDDAGDEYVEREFTLDWPANYKRATVDNETVALAHAVGDGNLDSLIASEVPVYYHPSGGYTSLATPDAYRLKNRVSTRLRRAAINLGLTKDSYPPEKADLRLGVSVFARLVAGFATVLLGLSLFTSSLTDPISRSTAISLMLPAILGFAVVPLAIVFANKYASHKKTIANRTLYAREVDEMKKSVYRRLFLITTLLFLIISLFTTPQSLGQSGPAPLRSIIAHVAHSVSGVGLTAISYHIFAETYRMHRRSLYESASDTVSRVKRWVNRRRGPDYWKG